MQLQPYHLIRLLIFFMLFTSCKQIVKSVDETLHPADTVAKAQAQTHTEYQVPDAVNIQQQVEEVLRTVVETHTSVHIDTHTDGKSKQFLTDTTALKKAEAALRALPQYAGKEIYVYQTAHFYDDGHISLMLRHPENPRYVDNYQYRNGKWSEPQPEQLSVRDNIEDRLVPLDLVNFVHIAGITKLYNEKASEIEGAKQSTHTYMTVWRKQPSWYPNSISGSRERYSIEFNADGTLKSFTQQ
ncbi:hypothetical protein [Chitinophaga tropicalis]|uniref:Uncharacterized protein n=1 Tax=Chitinophaga tropicalis TaxID=2683588 RepID=A0A7K1U0V6_9BACT|nr:hypothetical protein [Chitinophaga tropicalis]MVT08001.1 hypothetical protein [Chitinophaga tropicalis]